MRLALIGVGQAGGRVVDALLAYEASAGVDFVSEALAVNTARADLVGLDRVSQSRRILIGQARVKGHGVGADNELGAEVAAEDTDEILSAVDEIPIHEVDAFLLVAALGGGTGSGAAPVFAREISRLYTEPVYGLGILPTSDEGGIYALNAARSFQTFVREVDNLFVFDNDAWRHSGESVTEGHETVNTELARRLGVLFGAGETDGGTVAESVVDTSEIINTLGSGGVSTIGYASADVERPDRGFLARLTGSKPERTDRGFLARLTGSKPERTDDGDSMNRVTSLVRRATLGRLTLPCEVDSAERGLVVVAGPQERLSRRGIERSRAWLEEETGSMEIRGGDYPLDADHVAAVVLLSGVTDVSRIEKLQQIAIDAQRDRTERDTASSSRLEDLLRAGTENEDELDPLF
jgi:cell division GTPase FtsZ